MHCLGLACSQGAICTPRAQPLPALVLLALPGTRERRPALGPSSHTQHEDRTQGPPRAGLPEPGWDDPCGHAWSQGARPRGSGCAHEVVGRRVTQQLTVLSACN